ncbi:hypothetical protein BCR32DRAFT_287458 [Anaeromyces robustus]|uniref:Uncharacterized protein n=1 Tax=Anaeromyces robustus TaxID=1754192 RepID=A0A1Y1VRT2_9FUNG|nr:hypothetical protein BCR32DRAFT_287458 [Anaeromyces robustus]|eukprot:ORX63893.1 hypothetical protein BCR32DRAFT_287458 [Anaeromyces robustus]
MYKKKLDPIKLIKEMGKYNFNFDVSDNIIKNLNNELYEVLDKNEIEELHITTKLIVDSFIKVYNGKNTTIINFNFESCKQSCENSQKLLMSINENENTLFSFELIDKIIKTKKFLLLEISFCYTNSLIKDYLKVIASNEEESNNNNEDSSEDNILVKRGCDGNFPRSKFKKVSNMEVNYYKRNVNDILSRVDGCSAGIFSNDFYIPASTEFYAAVRALGNNGHKKDREWLEKQNNKKCLCSSTAKNVFIKKPFYLG